MPQPSLHVSHPERALARIGSVVHDCRIERLIGIGGMGAVYAATHRAGHRVAIKFMLEKFRDDPEVCELFSREAVAANQVGHPGAVPVIGHDVDEDGCAFLVMPLIEGETLRARWERAGRRLPPSEVGVLMADVTDVLAAAHARAVVHRDIKPENIFVTDQGEVRVLDFGIARRSAGGDSNTISGQMIGTPAFMPPEQALAQRDVIGPASDCWAVGATIFALLSGEYVHPAPDAPSQLAATATRRARSLAEVMPDLAAPLVRFVDRALAFEPANRWADADEMRGAMRAAFEEALGEPIALLAKRVRAEIALDLSHRTEETLARPVASMAKRSSPTPSGARIEPASSNLAGVEFNAQLLLSSSHLWPAVTNQAFAKHGLGHFAEDGALVPNPDLWWPLEPYLAAMREAEAAIGPQRMTEGARLVAKYFDLPTTLRDIHTAFRVIDMSYHLELRKDGQVMGNAETGTLMEGVGHRHYMGEPGTNMFSVVSSTPFPCSMERGAFIEFARRFEPHAVVEHARGDCRRTGAPSCTYHISWW